MQAAFFVCFEGGRGLDEKEIKGFCSSYNVCVGQLTVMTCWSTLALTTRDRAWCWLPLEVRTAVRLCSTSNGHCYTHPANIEGGWRGGTSVMCLADNAAAVLFLCVGVCVVPQLYQRFSSDIATTLPYLFLKIMKINRAFWSMEFWERKKPNYHDKQIQPFQFFQRVAEAVVPELT